MTKPTILDICCGAGGAAAGYAQAGFDVIGVDVEHHDFPFGDFYVMDAIEALEHVAANNWTFDGRHIDAIHISPPCQRWATAVIGVVVHKRHGSANPADQHVTMTLETFATLLEKGVRAANYYRPDDIRTIAESRTT